MQLGAGFTNHSWERNRVSPEKVLSKERNLRSNPVFDFVSPEKVLSKERNLRSNPVSDFVSQGIDDAVGKVGKPNPPTPFPAREGGAFKPLPASLRGWGGVRSWSYFINSIIYSLAGYEIRVRSQPD
ncbi:MAG TPA: hypothetical protein DCY88_19030 [Cyanobacteria bacterium UBA11372]|nr:hypothetical protein [Cyanobacteria bacterium UBA11372]HBE52028.1 hypothetical protein [Cyanobacteria bacterium UBA11369]